MRFSDLLIQLGELQESTPRHLAGDPELSGAAALDQAATGQLSFLEPGHALAAALAGCGASALLIPPDPELQQQATDQGLAWVALANPRLAFAEALDALYPRQRPPAGIHASAVVEPGAAIGPGVHIGAHGVVAAGSRIGAGSILHPGVVIYGDVEVGEGCELHAGAVLHPGSRLAPGCVVHSNAVVGSEGFGFGPTASGWRKMPQTGLVGLRSGMGLFANLRPVKILPALVDASSLKREVIEGVDLMVVRELTGGVYFGTPKGRIEAHGQVRAFNTMAYFDYEIDRIAKVGFDLAVARGGRLCSVDKANVLDVSQLWRDRVVAMGLTYPGVELSHMYVDNAAMQLVRAPRQFDVLLTSNLFGDILSDEAAMLTGSIGMLPSASLGSEGPGLFEPIHGSAPDIARQDKANPMAMVLSAAMLLRVGLKQEAAALALESAVDTVLDAGYRTGDLMAPGCVQLGCQAMGEQLLAALEA